MYQNFFCAPKYQILVYFYMFSAPTEHKERIMRVCACPTVFSPVYTYHLRNYWIDFD